MRVYFIDYNGINIRCILSYLTKCIPDKANPVLSLIITFSVALFGTVVWYFAKGSVNTFVEDAKHISNFNLFYTFLLVTMLVPVGLILFKESITLKSVIGIGLAMVGVLLMKA